MTFAERLLKSYEKDPSLDSLTRDDILAMLDEFPAERRGPLTPHAPRPLEPPPVELQSVEWSGGAFLAKTTADVQRVIVEARRRGRRVRVAGSQHSPQTSIFSPDPRDIRVLLDDDLRKMGPIVPDNEGATVWVGAGCYLGVNPEDPQSNTANSLNHQLEAKGFALPVLGGITHQSVAGFLQTGSAGGSLQHGFADAIEAIELVNGKGEVEVLTAGSDGFNAAGVSAGMLGVVTRVRFRVRTHYFVEGTETNHEHHDSFLHRTSAGYPLSGALSDVEYLHLNWYPQEGVQRVTQWVGKRTNITGERDEYTSELKNGLMTALAAFVLAITGTASSIDPNGPVARKLIAILFRTFVSLERRETFRDAWLRVLPCDDQVRVDTLIKIIFTEIWLPLDQLTATLDRLKTLLENRAVAGNLIVELYGARESPFWLSPSHGRKVVRVDVFWWAYNLGNPRDRFEHFWDALLELPGARLHWGKHLPEVGKRYGNVVFGPEFLRRAYPKLDDWLTIRRAMDPDGVFVTDYWRDILGAG